MLVSVVVLVRKDVVNDLVLVLMLFSIVLLMLSEVLVWV